MQAQLLQDEAPDAGDTAAAAAANAGAAPASAGRSTDVPMQDAATQQQDAAAAAAAAAALFWGQPEAGAAQPQAQKQQAPQPQQQHLDEEEREDEAPEAKLEKLFDSLAAAVQKRAGCSITAVSLRQAGVVIDSFVDGGSCVWRLTWPGRGFEARRLWRYSTAAKQLLAVPGALELLGVPQPTADEAGCSDARPHKRHCTAAAAAACTGNCSPQKAAAAAPGTAAKVRVSVKHSHTPAAAPPKAIHAAAAKPPQQQKHQRGSRSHTPAAPPQAPAAPPSGRSLDQQEVLAGVAAAVSKLEAAHAAVSQALAQQQQSEGDAAAAGAAAAGAAAPEAGPAAAAPRPAQQQLSSDAAAAPCFLRLLDAFLQRISTYRSVVLNPPEGTAGGLAVLIFPQDLQAVPPAVLGMLQHHQGLLQRLQQPERKPQHNEQEDDEEEEEEWTAASYDPEGWLQEQLQRWLDPALPELRAARIPVVKRPRLAPFRAELERQREQQRAQGPPAVGAAAAPQAGAGPSRPAAHRLTARKSGWRERMAKQLANEGIEL